MRYQKMAFGRQDDVFLGMRIALKCQDQLGQWQLLLCFVFFLCQTHFHWLISLPSLSPWGKLLSINHVRFAVGNTFLSEQVNILWRGLKAEYRKNYLPIQKKLNWYPLYLHQASNKANWHKIIFSTFNKAVFTCKRFKEWTINRQSPIQML